MGVQFKYVNATPPGGWYEYAIDDHVVRGRTRLEVCRQVRALHQSLGLPVFGDGFIHVMEYMCPFLPNGFCTQPSTVAPPLSVQEVKAKTATLFTARIVTADVAERRLEACVRCPCHTRRGVCSGCTGLLDWVVRGFRGARGRLPADNASGVCTVEKVMTAALASVDIPVDPELEYPENCWRAPTGRKEAHDGANDPKET